MPKEKLLQLLREIAEERIPFNKLIGINRITWHGQPWNSF